MTRPPSDARVADLAAQDDCSAIAYRWAEKTFAQRRGELGEPLEMPVAPFAAWLDMRGSYLAMTSDGIGTKIEIAERLGRYDTLGFDLVAMVVDDLAANGAEPIAVTNTLDVDRTDPAVVDELMRGLHAAAVAARVAVVGGEIAELGERVGGWGQGMHFNWCATAVGSSRARPITGAEMRPGDLVVALRSSTFRSNGYSAMRAILERSFGPGWHAQSFEGQSWGAWLLAPCAIHAPLIVELARASSPPRGLAHVTGGGIPSKLGRTLRAAGLGADLDALFPPTPAMRELQRLGEVPDDVAYRRWNMGNGFFVIVDPKDAERTIEAAAAFGFEARVAGVISTTAGVRIGALEFDG